MSIIKKILLYLFYLTFFQVPVLPVFAAALPETTRTLNSLQKIDDLLYVMTFYGEYGFEKILKEGYNPFPAACSSFSAVTPGGEHILAHNADGITGPVLLMYYRPAEGYASVAIVSLHMLGYSPGDWDDLHLAPPEKRAALLDAPRYPHAGMNRRGLAFAEMMAQGGGEAVDPGKTTIDGGHCMRLVLDHAGTVEEAVTLLRKYNNRRSSIEHYLIADAAGDSAVVEYREGRVVVTRRPESWLVATNFRILNADPGDIMYRCRRYQKACGLLNKYRGRVSIEKAMDILETISVKTLKWWNVEMDTGSSIIFNTNRWEIDYVSAMRYDRVHRFKFDDNSLVQLESSLKQDVPRREHAKRVFQLNEIVETTSAQWETLRSLRKIRSFVLYIMEYRGGYDFEEFLEQGVETLWYFEANTTGPPAPYLALFTNPPGGFASMSFVSLTRMGYPIARDGIFDDWNSLIGLLEAPYWPESGVNIHGLFAVACPVRGGIKTPGTKEVTLNGPQGLRLILDYTENIDQAAELLGKYKTDASGSYRYYIADASGRSVVLNQAGGDPVITSPSGNEAAYCSETLFLYLLIFLPVFFGW